MKKVRQAIILVDTHRRPSRKRNTAGRYRVGAKTKEEAIKLVQNAIGFGSVQFYYWDDSNTRPKAKYKEVIYDFTYEKAHHACEDRRSYE